MFPDGWYDRFEKSLQVNAGTRLQTKILPKCDRPNLCKVAMLHILNLEEFAIERTRRKKDITQKLRERARQLSSEVPKTMVGFKSIEDFVGSIEFQKLAEFEHIKRMLNRVPEAFNSKRMGVFQDNSLLFVIRQYLLFRSGLVPKPSELAVIVKAALAGLARPPDYQIVDSEQLRQNLHNFEKNSPAFCQLVDGPRAAQFVESPSQPPQY